jgi:hypothetical protein
MILPRHFCVLQWSADCMHATAPQMQDGQARADFYESGYFKERAPGG